MIKRLIFKLWPPYEARNIDKQIEKKNSKTGDDARWESILTELRNALPQDATKYEELEMMARQIQEAEWKRKETLENKASTFVAGIGVAFSIITIVPALFADQWQIPIIWAYIAGTAYLLAITHFLVAAYYAVQVRRVGSFSSPCADTFLDSVKQHQGQIKERIILTVAQAKWNEDFLLRKSNYLSVTEDLFLRGLALVAFAAVISVAVKLVM